MFATLTFVFSSIVNNVYTDMLASYFLSDSDNIISIAPSNWIV